MIDRCEGDTANMVRVAWMKNCGGKRERERRGPGPWEGKRGGVGRGRSWMGRGGASKEERGKETSLFLEF